MRKNVFLGGSLLGLSLILASCGGGTGITPEPVSTLTSLSGTLHLPSADSYDDSPAIGGSIILNVSTPTSFYPLKSFSVGDVNQDHTFMLSLPDVSDIADTLPDDAEVGDPHCDSQAIISDFKAKLALGAFTLKTVESGFKHSVTTGLLLDDSGRLDQGSTSVLAWVDRKLTIHGNLSCKTDEGLKYYTNLSENLVKGWNIIKRTTTTDSSNISTTIITTEVSSTGHTLGQKSF